MATQHQERHATSLHPALIANLRTRLRGPLLTPGMAGYDGARSLWNAMIDRHPAVIARCIDSADVQTAVSFAREHDLVVSIKGGGHNVAGNAVCDDGLMIDLSLMKGIEVDPDAQTVTAQGGVVWGEFDRATQQHGLATTGGAIPTTGIAGLTLGGGHGFLMRRCGLTCDNVLAASIVTADGALLSVSATEHADLFWGLRGGGGNFGVVTSFTYQLHPVGPLVLAGALVYPFDRARDVLQFYREFTANQPDELSVYAGMKTGADGNRVLALVIGYAGSLEDGERVLTPLRRFGRPIADLVAPMPYTALQELFAPAYPSGRRNYWKSSFLDTMSDAAIDTMIEQFAAVPSPFSTAAIEPMGGAVGRVGEDATAYSQRGARYNLLLSAGWVDPTEDEANIRWTRGFWHAMRPHSREDVYVNYLDVDEQSRTRAAYGTKYDRLVAVKTRYDPTNLFRMNHNIQPLT